MKYKIIEGFEVFFFEKVSSTMNVAREFLPKECIIVAEEQTEGRGRYGRKWISPKGGLYFSLILKENEFTRFLSEILSLTLIKTFENLGIKNCQIKFPNDIIINGKKISGILIEKTDNFYIAGVGINVENKEELKSFITMECILSKKVEKEKLLEEFIKNFKQISKGFVENSDEELKNWSENLIK